MLLKNKINIVWLSSTATTNTSKISTMDQNNPTPLNSLNSWTSPMKNSKPPTSDTSPKKKMNKTSSSHFKLLTYLMFPTQLTGELKMLLPQLRTKDNVVPAGHSPPLVLLKVWVLSAERDCKVSLNNNWLTVIPLNMDAMEVLWKMLSDLLPVTVSFMKVNIHTLPEREPAEPQVVPSETDHTRLLEVATNLNPL